MRTSPQNIVACLAGDLLVDEALIIDAISGDEEILAIFRDTVEDFTEYASLVKSMEEAF
jgi:hypothetical protein